jgi:hypothetical protein
LQVKVRAEILEILEQQAMLVVQGIREILVEREQQETQEWEILAIVVEEIQVNLVVLVVVDLEVLVVVEVVVVEVVVEIQVLQVTMEVGEVQGLQDLLVGKMVVLEVVLHHSLEVEVVMDLMEVLEILEVMDLMENQVLAQEMQEILLLEMLEIHPPAGQVVWGHLEILVQVQLLEVQEM